jgi:tyrosyl-tRNA synthetase
LPRTSPYQFYQFWLNASDEDVKNYIRIFTLMKEEEILALEQQHTTEPHVRHLQKALAKDITIRVHSEGELNAAIEASDILFGKGTTENLQKLSVEQILDIFSGVPQYTVAKSAIEASLNMVDLLSVNTQISASKGEAKRILQSNAVSVNKSKVNEETIVSSADLLNGKYILVQKGKKDYYLIVIQ